jgi:hypothetical protein
MNYQKLVGTFAEDPIGNRLLVEAVGPAGEGLPYRAICRHIEGERKGVRVQWWADSLRPLGPEIPIVKTE